MRSLLLVVACSGCIEPTLLVCGDNICPITTTCLDGVVCATQDQIEACTGLAETAACHATTGDGFCTHGACTPNQCGDGQVTGIEPCDGGLVSVGCADFGYYSGTTSCTPLCTIDRSACVGRCGDGIVQTDQFEECDGAPPSYDCTDLGYDYGALTCATTCAPSTVKSCERFGWRQLGPIKYPASVVGDAGMYAIMDDTGIAVHEAITTTHAGAFVAIDARAGDVLAGTLLGVERYHAGAWTVLPAPALQADQTIAEVTLADDGTAFLLATGPSSCAIGRLDGTSWTIIPAAAGCSRLRAFSGGDYAIAVSDGTVRRQFPGCTAAPGDPCECMRAYSVGGATPNVFAIDRDGGGNLLAYVHETTSQTLRLDLVPTCGFGPPDTKLGNFDIGQPRVRGTEVFTTRTFAFDATVSRFAEGRIETIAGPPALTGEPPDIYTTHDGIVYMEVDGSLWRMNRIVRSGRGAPGETPVFKFNSAIAIGADGTFAECSQHVMASSDTVFHQLGGLSCSTTYPCCSALFVRSASSIYAAMAPQLTWWNGSTWTPQVLAAAPIDDVVALAGTATVVAAIRASGSVIANLGAGWVTLAALPATCTASALAVAADGTIYAAGSCSSPAGAEIWKYDGAWTEVHADASSSGYISLAIAGDTLFAAGGDQSIAIGNGTAWTSYPSAGAALAVVSPTDAFALNVSVPSRVTHWDGARWTPININAANDYFGIVANATNLAMFGQLKVSQPYPVWESFVRSP